MLFHFVSYQVSQLVSIRQLGSYPRNAASIQFYRVWCDDEEEQEHPPSDLTVYAVGEPSGRTPWQLADSWQSFRQGTRIGDEPSMVFHAIGETYHWSRMAPLQGPCSRRQEQENMMRNRHMSLAAFKTPFYSFIADSVGAVHECCTVWRLRLAPQLESEKLHTKVRREYCAQCLRPGRLPNTVIHINRNRLNELD